MHIAEYFQWQIYLLRFDEFISQRTKTSQQDKINAALTFSQIYHYYMKEINHSLMHMCRIKEISKLHLLASSFLTSWASWIGGSASELRRFNSSSIRSLARKTWKLKGYPHPSFTEKLDTL